MSPFDERAEQMLVACCFEKPEIVDQLKDGLWGDERCKAVHAFLKGLRGSLGQWNGNLALNELGRLDWALWKEVESWRWDLPSADGWAYWEAVVRETAVVRHTAVIAEEMRGAGSEVDIGTYIKRLQKIEEAKSRLPAPTAAHVIDETLAELEERYGDDRPFQGISTGIPRLDRMTDALCPGQLWVMAARPSVGKTTWACNVALSTVLTAQVGTAFYSLEMPRQRIMRKMFFAKANVSMSRYRHRQLSQHDFDGLAMAAAELRQSPLYVMDTDSGLSAITTSIRKLSRENGIKIAIVDYLQKVTVEGSESDRWADIARVSNTLKSVAMDTGVCVVALAQVSRAVETEKRKPSLADLKGSSEIEADADVVAFLHKDKDVTLIVSKAREGEPGDVRLMVDYDTGRMGEAEERPGREDSK